MCVSNQNNNAVYISHKEHLRSYHEAGDKLAKFIKHRKGDPYIFIHVSQIVNRLKNCSSFGRGGEKSKESFC